MNIDIESVKQAIGALGSVVTVFKQAKDLLPDNKNKQEVVVAIENAERQIKIAEAQIARGMGYVICRNHFPPEIMLSQDNNEWRCLACGNIIDNTPKLPKLPSSLI